MSKKQQTITSLPLSPDEERHGRVVRYVVAMSVRLICVVLVFFLQGGWQFVAIAGAIVLPYFAVVVANVKMQRGGRAEAPGEYGTLVPLAPRDRTE